MIWLLLLTVLMVPEPDAAPPSSEQIYERPAVRPFEPPSDFGRAEAQGDNGLPVFRKRLTAPVALNAYCHSYGVTRSEAEIAYDQGVTQAEIDYDTRMGALDGRWSVVDGEGRVVATLVLIDHGDDRMIEGAWLRSARPGEAVDLQPLEVVRRDLEGRVSVGMGQEGEMKLSPIDSGTWAGLHHQGSRAGPVVLRRLDTTRSPC